MGKRNQKGMTLAIALPAVFVSACVRDSRLSDFNPPQSGDGGLISLGGVDLDSITIQRAPASDHLTSESKLECRAFYSPVGNIAAPDAILLNGTAVADWRSGPAHATFVGLNAGSPCCFNLLVRDESGNPAAYSMARYSTYYVVPAMTCDGSIIRSTGRPRSTSTEMYWSYGNGGDIGLGDMSESDGSIPGTSIGARGQPSGTHEDGARSAGDGWIHHPVEEGYGFRSPRLLSDG